MMISVTSPKGGSGKSTLAFNLASLFTRDGYLTCIADCDDSQTSLRWGQIRARATEELPSVDVIWTPDGIVVNQLKRLGREYSVIIVDSMPTYGNADTKILKMTNYNLIPVRCSGPDIQSLYTYMNRIEEMRAYRDIKLETGIVINQYNAQSNIDKWYHKWLQSQPWKPFQELIHHRVPHKEPFIYGMGINEMYALSRKREYKAAADEMEAFYQALLGQLRSTPYGDLFKNSGHK
ncbi:ParA family protein [Spirosoma litoris]